jgi:ribonuclease D
LKKCRLALSPSGLSIPSTPGGGACEDPNVRLIAPTKAETALLEPFQRLPLQCIHLLKTAELIEQAGREIVAAGIAGFDTESKPTFQAGEKSRGPHIVQFALRDKAFIFQLHRPECRALVAELLQSDQVLKVGFGLRNDRAQIRATLGVTLDGVLDLDTVFRRRGYKGHIGVRAAVGAVLQRSFRKSKRVTTSNWAAEKLTPSQLLYAANDAYAALQVMEALEGANERSVHLQR